MNKIDFETASNEFKRWAEAKRIPENAMKKHEEDSEAIIEALQNGYLMLDEENCFIHKLAFPLKNGEISELKYKFRVSKGELSASVRGLRSDNLIGEMAICYVSCLTDQQRGIIRAMDSTDSSLAEHIAAFFLI